MNNKTKAVAGAGAGLLALSMIGGGTFALWQDYQVVTGNEAQAGALTLEADREAMSTGLLAPGESKTTYRYVASRSDQTTALENAKLSISIDNVKSSDDGCTSNTEKADEVANSYSQFCDSNGGSPYVQAGTGHFADQAWLQVRAGSVTDEDACNPSAGTSPKGQMTLANWNAAAPLLLAELDPDQGICIAFELGLPDGRGSSADAPGIDFAGSADTDNAVQGDSATFDVRFDLEQQLDNV